MTASHSSPLAMIAVALLVFPKLALGMSGFETGVAVMPQIRGDSTDTYEKPAGRIRDTRKLLTTAALIMSCFLLLSSLATTILIPEDDFEAGGPANGRALAYLAHEHLGEAFGTVYDVSTIAILWFAGASALAGLLNLVPRYLPRYGMAPEWTRAVRPLVLVFMAIAVGIPLWFDADVDAQSGAYATGVLVLMLSASFASTIAARARGHRRAAVGFGPGRARRREARRQEAPGRERRHPQHHRRRTHGAARADRAGPARLLQLDRGQPRGPAAALPRLRGRRGRAGHA